MARCLLIALLLIFLKVDFGLSACVSPYVDVDGGCYYFSDLDGNIGDTWAGSDTTCQLMEGTLLVLETEEEFFSVTRYMTLMDMCCSAWIGVYEMSEGTFVWMDMTLLPLDSPFWGSGQPAVGSPPGVGLMGTNEYVGTDVIFRWRLDTESDWYERNYICETSPISTSEQ